MHNWTRLILSLLICGITGCGTSDRIAYVQSRIPSYEPSNSFASQSIPSNIRRIVILPIYSSSQDWTILDPIDDSFKAELLQTQIFEVLTLGRNDLQAICGASQVNSTQLFPNTLARHLQNTLHADAVLLIDLTHFRPYKPLAIGVRAKIVSLHDNSILWAFDALFDAGDPRVAMGARRYQERFATNDYPLSDAISTLQSPRQFARYAAFTSFQSLPQHYCSE